jgi:leucyl-tRNA---protein transferase
MFAQIEYPEKLLPEELDNYLSKGWFRMRQTIFTTNFLHFKQQFYSAIWLRVGLDDYIADKKYFTLHKLNNGFRTETKKSITTAITPEHELLYRHYRQSISFDISPSLHELLFGAETHNRFNTHEVNIYDGERLIAAGFFDLGQKSAAGITCIYHPAYKKYSLGKYLMYLKIDFCKQRQLQYFYPGYVVPGCAPFDYKLTVGKATLQYLQLSTQNWQAFTQAASIQNPLKEMLEKLTELRNQKQPLQYPFLLPVF